MRRVVYRLLEHELPPRRATKQCKRFYRFEQLVVEQLKHKRQRPDDE
jgi:hypothetical protein